LEINTERLRRNPCLVRHQICKRMRKKSVKT
jgi:hypothetical protein